MGLSITSIHFEASVPSFQAICQHYERLTGLPLVLKASIHVAEGPSTGLAGNPASLWEQLQADAAAVVALDAGYEVEMARLTQLRQYESAAALRDELREKKRHLTHINGLELVVGRGDFYAIEFTVTGSIVAVYQYGGQYYAVASLLKTLVDLGGHYLGADGHPLPTLPAKWRNLKRWDEYSWYNRPPK